MAQSRGRVQVTFDCVNPVPVAQFWAEVMRYPPPDVEGWRAHLRAEGEPDENLDAWCSIKDPAGEGPNFFFQRVPEEKVVKNRVHLDVRISTQAPSDRATIDAEVDRLIGLGAVKLRSKEDGDSYFVVLQDIEGNEFCID